MIDLVQKYKELLTGVQNTLSQPVQNLKNWGQVLTNPQTRQEYQQYVVQPAADKIPKPVSSFTKGFGNMSTLGLVKNFDEEKPGVAYRAGQIAGLVNPFNPVNKAMGALNIGGRVAGRIAPKATSFVAKRVVPGVISELAQTGAYTGAQQFAGATGIGEKIPLTKEGVAANLLVGLGLRGGFSALAPQAKPTVTGLATKSKMVFKPKSVMTGEEIKITDDIISQFNLDGILKRENKNFIDNILSTKAGASLSKLKSMSEREKLNEIAKFTNISEDFQVRDMGMGLVGKNQEKPISNPTGSYKDLQKDVAQISRKELSTQLNRGSAIRTKANEVVSSIPSISQKGKLNINRLNVEGAGKEVLENQQARVKPTVIGNKEVVEQAKLATGAKGAISDAQMKNLMAQQVKNRQKVVDLTARYNKAIADGAPETEILKIALDIDKQSLIAQQGGTFAGRLLQAQNIIADKSATPMQKVFALLHNAEVPTEKYMRDAIKVNWDDPASVVSFYRKYVPPSFSDVLTEVRYSNMLSSPLTHIVNLSSNAMQTGIVAPIEKTITGVLDFGKSALTGSERKYYTSAGIDYAGGYVKALPQAYKKALNVLSGKDVSIRPDYENMPTGSTGVMKAYTLPLRALEAMDQFFRTLVQGGSLAELKKGPLKLTGEQMIDKATKEADYRLFRQAFDPNGELGQGVVLQIFDKWNSAIANLRRLPGGKWVLPFLQTPTNILKQGFEYSPMGFTTAIGAKAPLEQLSKAILGTGVLMGAYQLAENGLVSWEAPSSETERELYYAAGMQPYSVKIGNNWVSFSKLGPLSYPFAMAAAMANAQRTNPDKGRLENFAQGAGGMLGFFGDQSYVRSIGDLVDAIQGGVNIGPNAISSEAANMAGQLVPYKSFLTWVGRITDPTYRKANTFQERMIKDLPVVGSGLEPYTNLEGNPSMRDYPLLNAISPFKVSREKESVTPMYDEYREKRIQRGVEKRLDQDFQQGNKTAQSAGGIFRYIDESGSLRKIELPENSKVTKLDDRRFFAQNEDGRVFYYKDEKGNYKDIEIDKDIKAPKYIGNEAVDKLYKSEYTSKLNARSKDAIEAYEQGFIDQGEMMDIVGEVEKIKASAKKAKKPALKKLSVKAPKITIPKVSKGRFKVARPKTVKKYTIKKNKVKRYTVGKLPKIT